MLESKAIQAEHSIKTQNTQIGEEPGRRTVDTAIGGQDPIDVERTLLLDRYKQECRSVGVRVTDEMIAKAASPSWNDRTQVTWWKRNDPRSKPQADKAIRRVLSNKPHLP